jgi:hypothetical protein
MAGRDGQFVIKYFHLRDAQLKLRDDIFADLSPSMITAQANVRVA